MRIIINSNKSLFLNISYQYLKKGEISFTIKMHSAVHQKFTSFPYGKNDIHFQKL